MGFDKRGERGQDGDPIFEIKREGREQGTPKQDLTKADQPAKGGAGPPAPWKTRAAALGTNRLLPGRQSVSRIRDYWYQRTIRPSDPDRPVTSPRVATCQVHLRRGNQEK